MFRPIDGISASARVRFTLDGQEFDAAEGDTLAIALLKADVWKFRETAVSGAARAPLCMMGVCFECLVEVDGVPNSQACMVKVQPGMKVRLQRGARHAEVTK